MTAHIEKSKLLARFSFQGLRFHQRQMGWHQLPDLEIKKLRRVSSFALRPSALG